MTVPHGGFHVPEDSVAEYRGKFPEGPPLSSENGRQAPRPEPRAAFAGMMSRLDRYVGQVLALLQELNLERDTIVFFTSDNGGIRFNGNFFLNTGPFRGSKGNLYEGGIRVPMIVRWPGRVPTGKVSAFAWAFHDVLPTLLGKSQKPHAELYWEHPRYNSKAGSFTGEIPMQAMRRGNWKAVRPKPGGAVELYDLKSDPGEERDLASRKPGLAAEFDRAMKAARVPPRPQNQPPHHGGKLVASWRDKRRILRRHLPGNWADPSIPLRHPTQVAEPASEPSTSTHPCPLGCLPRLNDGGFVVRIPLSHLPGIAEAAQTGRMVSPDERASVGRRMVVNLPPSTTCVTCRHRRSHRTSKKPQLNLAPGQQLTAHVAGNPRPAA